MPIEITGLEEIVRKLESLDDPKVFRDPMRRSTEYLKDILSEYPPKAAGAFTDMARPGQRRAYWAKVSSGEISHGSGGYQRTGKTGQGWTIDISTNGREGKVGNIKPGARWVYGATTQQPFHAASTFPRVDKVAKKEAPKIVGFFKAALDKAVKR